MVIPILNLLTRRHQNSNSKRSITSGAITKPIMWGIMRDVTFDRWYYFYTLILTILFFASAPQQAFSTTYYINANSGNDEDIGITPEMPWKTLHKANDTVLKPGDQLLFAAGCVWHGQLNILYSGTVEHPITIGAYGIGPLPVISGGKKIEGWSASSHDENVWEYSLAENPYYPYWLSLDTMLLNENTGPENLNDLQWYYDTEQSIIYLKNKIGNPDQTGQDIEIGYYRKPLYVHADNLIFQNLKLIGGRDLSIYLYECNNIILKNLVIERGGWTSFLIKSASNIVINTLEIKHVPHGNAFYIQDSGVALSNAIIKDTYHDPAVTIHSSKVNLEHSIVAGNRLSALKALDSSDVVIEKCLIFANGYNLDFSASGSNLFSDTSSTVLVDNTLIDGYGRTLQQFQEKTVGENIVLLGNNLIYVSPKLRSYSANEGIISINVDDTDIDYVEDMIAALKPYKSPVTFFVIQNSITRKNNYQQRLQNIVEKGSEIGCHSYSHPFLSEPLAFNIQYLLTSTATLSIKNHILSIQVADHPEHSLILDLTSPDVDHTNKLISYFNSYMGGGIYRAINIVSEAHGNNSHYSKSTDLPDIQNITINQPTDIFFDFDRFYQTQLLESKHWLEEVIGNDYVVRTFAAPYSNIDYITRNYLQQYGYLGQRGIGHYHEGMDIWHTRCLNDIYVFGIGQLNPTSFHQADESLIRAFARHLALLGLEKGMLISLLTHVAEDFTADEWQILVDELSFYPDIRVWTLRDSLKYIENSGLWKNIDDKNMRWVRHFTDKSEYVPQSDSPILDLDAGLKNWLKTNLPYTDINNDGDVDGQDLSNFIMAYGTVVGNDAFQASCEFNGSGTVDQQDLKLFAQTYGKI